MPQFQTVFTTPAVVTNVVATAATDRSAIALAWDVAAMAPQEFVQYVIYRRVVGDAEWTYAGAATDQNDPTFDDVQAPHRVALEYSVRVDNGWAQGDDTLASTTLPLDYWIVAADDPGLVFAIPHVSAYSEALDPQAETFRPLDRPNAVVVGGTVTGPDGSVRSMLLPAEAGVYGLLRAVTARAAPVYLKNPFGDVHYVRLTKLAKEPFQAGAQTASFDYVTVDA